MEEKQKKYARIGLIGTLVFHGVVVVLLLIFGFSTPLPLPAEEGVIVNLGYSETGSGPVQPREPAETNKAQPKPSSSEPEEVATSDNPDAPTINSSQNPQENNQSTTNNNYDNTQQQQVNQNLLFGQKHNSDGGSEGNDDNGDDKGKPGGDPDSRRYEGTPGGNGDSPNFSLKGRISKSLPRPNNNFQEQGKVVVKIWVDREGNVIAAEPGFKGSTTTDSRLYKLAKQAALKAKFSSKNDAPSKQTGTITYTFIQLQ